MEEEGTLKWRFDVSTFRLIGRDLITDRVTALFELVKNCYDANATGVTVTFKNVGLNGPASSICIQDNGVGMSFEDIRDKWMVIGTSNKRINPYSPAPFSRKCVGEKGIGRFAVDKLGDNVNIITKQKDSPHWLDVEIKWDDYFGQKEPDGGLRLFTDIGNKYFHRQATDINEHGTTLEITNVREIWVESDIRRFISEASKIVSPFVNIGYPFKIKVVAEEYGISETATKNMDDISIATINFSLGYDDSLKKQDWAVFNESTGKVDIGTCPMKNFGGIKMRLFYFDDMARRRYRKEFPNNQIDGVKIYRDNIIATPFAESQSDDDKKRDVLGIDKRLWQNIFDRVSSREIIGIVEITKVGNPDIIDATNRQDFVDNPQYRELKEFIILQLDAIENYKKYVRNKKRGKHKSEDIIENAEQNISAIISAVENISKENAALKVSFAPIIKQAKKTSKAVHEVIKERKMVEEEFARKENVYMSIMSLQEYAFQMSHAVRTSLNKIRDRVEYFCDYFPNPDEDDIFKQYAKEMSKEFKILNRVIDFMLSYSRSNLYLEDVEIVSTIREIFLEYENLIKKNGIESDLILPDKIVLEDTNRQFFRDIIQNLLDNSIKAVKDSKQKIIKCSVMAEEDELVILFSDTGGGIPVERRNWVFGIYNTTTQEQGGGGLGLYIVKTRVKSMKGGVEIVDSEFGSIGTTVKIKLPFKK